MRDDTEESSLEGQAMICLACDQDIHLYTAADGSEASPEEGDLSMCWYCGALAFYTVTDGVLGLRQPTGEEARSLVLNGYVQEMLQKRKELMADW